ncbi:Lcl C-terminal domain-containing protein [Desulfobulbus alkaliphilus]|uniref:Lcl C-terminal domain-containing protein n=1 Tax=Desulfobulbus alkaliphilus TaxID=869814 RepID=UPI0019633033|nr:DUF1566 domain-containing protein [Desulfobulbus alkaliphilus]MBM9537744.1 DUF1566 domain-containing protein [Desulfobulbus alkaliphilus]
MNQNRIAASRKLGLRILASGQNTCHAADGSPIPCLGSGQDGEFFVAGDWPVPRFQQQGMMVLDQWTGLTWTTDANPEEFPLLWQECFDAVEEMNREKYGGWDDWRMPGRRELHSLISFAASRPALAEEHPFRKVFLGWYWSSTTYAGQTAYAWRVHMEGGRMFFGSKNESSLLWPVRGESPIVPASGQAGTYDPKGRDAQHGVVLPDPRFVLEDESVVDLLAGLRWLRRADLCGPVSWQQALERVVELRRVSPQRAWRLPSIRELDSLTDASRSFPALAAGHPFQETGDGYWSSTSSSFACDWAMVLYLGKGAVGVGYKQGDPFLAWPVCDG